MPRRLVGQDGSRGAVPRRLTPIYRDREELRAGDTLGVALLEALAESQSLVVICSPASAKSDWVDAEVNHYLGATEAPHVLPFLVAGIPNAIEPEDECLPPSLRSVASLGPPDGGITMADRRDGATHDAELMLIAGLAGVAFDEIRQRDRRRARRKGLAAVLIALSIAVILGSSVLWALGSSRSAQEAQGEAAEERRARADLEIRSLETDRMLLLDELAVMSWSEFNERGDVSRSLLLSILTAELASEWGVEGFGVDELADAYSGIAATGRSASGVITRIGITADGSYAALVTDTGSVDLVNTATGDVVWRHRIGFGNVLQTEQIRFLIAHPQHPTFVVEDSLGRLSVLRVYPRTGAVHWQSSPAPGSSDAENRRILSGAFSADGLRLAVIWSDDSIELFDYSYDRMSLAYSCPLDAAIRAADMLFIDETVVLLDSEGNARALIDATNAQGCVVEQYQPATTAPSPLATWVEEGELLFAHIRGPDVVVTGVDGERGILVNDDSSTPSGVRLTSDRLGAIVDYEEGSLVFDLTGFGAISASEGSVRRESVFGLRDAAKVAVSSANRGTAVWTTGDDRSAFNVNRTDADLRTSRLSYTLYDAITANDQHYAVGRGIEVLVIPWSAASHNPSYVHWPEDAAGAVSHVALSDDSSTLVAVGRAIEGESMSTEAVIWSLPVDSPSSSPDLVGDWARPDDGDAITAITLLGDSSDELVVGWLSGDLSLVHLSDGQWIEAARQSVSSGAVIAISSNTDERIAVVALTTARNNVVAVVNKSLNLEAAPVQFGAVGVVDFPVALAELDSGHLVVSYGSGETDLIDPWSGKVDHVGDAALGVIQSAVTLTGGKKVVLSGRNGMRLADVESLSLSRPFPYASGRAAAHPTKEIILFATFAGLYRGVYEAENPVALLCAIVGDERITPAEWTDLLGDLADYRPLCDNSALRPGPSDEELLLGPSDMYFGFESGLTLPRTDHRLECPTDGVDVAGYIIADEVICSASGLPLFQLPTKHPLTFRTYSPGAEYIEPPPGRGPAERGDLLVLRRYDGGISIDGLEDGERTLAISVSSERATIVAHALVVDVGSPDAAESIVIGHDGESWSEVLRVGGIEDLISEADTVACDRLAYAARISGEVANYIESIGDLPVEIRVIGDALALEGLGEEVQVPHVASDGFEEVSSFVRRAGESYVCATRWS